MKRLIAVVALLFTASAIGQLFTSGRVGQYDFVAETSDGQFISGHQRQDKADEACQKWSWENDLKPCVVRGSSHRWMPTAEAQLVASAVRPVNLSSVTGGAVVGLLTSSSIATEGGITPASTNRVYADTTDSWQPNDFPTEFEGVQILKTLDADAASTGDTTKYSVTLDSAGQLCVLSDDSISSQEQPDWLTGSYAALGEHGTLPVNRAATLYCRPAGAGSYNFGGNCKTTCPTGAKMYVVFVVPGYRRVPAINQAPPDDPGTYNFGNVGVSNNESTTAIRFDVIRVGSTVGAASVEVYDTGTGTGVADTDYVAFSPVTYSWASGEGGGKCCVTITLNAVTANKTIIVGLQNASPAGFTLTTNTPTTNALVILNLAQPGNYRFSITSASDNESTTFATRGIVSRINGSTGAVSVQVHDTGMGTGVSGVDYNAITPFTASWADGDAADKCCVSITANAVTADKTYTLGFQSASGITADSVNQTFTGTIVNNATPPPDPNPSPTLVITETGGSDANLCTAASPCSTLGRAASIANPGDIIEMRATGDTIWTYPNYTTLTRSGAAGNPITLRVQAGDTVNFYPATTNGNILRFDGASYWHIDGSGATIRIGDRAQWREYDCQSAYNQLTGITGVNSAHHIEFGGDTTHLIEVAGGRQWAANVFDGTTHHLYFHDVNFDLHGTNADDTGAASVNSTCGDLIEIYAPDTKLERVGAAHGGHDSLSIFGIRTVLRNSTLNGDWTDTTSGYPGMRDADIYPAWTHYSFPASSVAPYGPVLVEGNIFKGSAASLAFNSNARSKLSGTGIITRYNFVYDNNSQGWQFDNNACCVTVDNAVGHQRTYHNTYYAEWGMISSQGSAAYASPPHAMSDWRQYNELGAEQRDPTPIKHPYWIDWVNPCQMNQQGYPDFWLGAVFAGNRYSRAAGTMMRIRMYCSPNSGVVDGIAAAIAKWPNVWLSSNEEAASTFVNAAARTKAGLQLASGTGTAIPMATVTAASSGTTVTLSDTWWIYDGFDLAYYGETGDYIAFYSSGGTLKGIRQVTNVDPFTNSLATISSSISLVVGDVVRPVLKDGSTVWTNKGAPVTP